MASNAFGSSQIQSSQGSRPNPSPVLHLAEAWEHLIEGCALISFDWEYLYANEAAAQAAQIARGDLVGRTLHDAHPGIEPSELFARYRQCMEQRRAQVFEAPFPPGSSELYTFHVQPAAEGIFVASLPISEHSLAEERFRLAVEEAPNAIIMVNHAGEIVLLNAQAEQYFGYAPGELLGANVEQLVPEIPSERHTAHRAKFAREPYIRDVGVGRDLRARRKDGSEFPVEVGLVPISTPDETFVLATIIDITERKRAETELRDQEENWRKLFALLPVGISVVNEQSSVVELNTSLARILGLSRQQLIQGEHAKRRYFRPDKTPMPPEEFPSQRALKEQRPINSVEIGVEKEDGTVIWTNVSAVPLASQDAVVTVTVDTTLQKQAEAALHDSNEKFDSLFDLTPVAACLSTLADGCVVAMNQAFAQTFGHTTAQARGKTLRELGISAGPELHQQLLAALQTHGRARNIEASLLTDSGEHCSFLINADLLSIGDQPHYIKIMQDITAHKQATMAQRQLDAKLQQTQKLESLGVLAGGIAHDFNNLLASIMGYTDLALLELPPQSLAEPLLNNAIQGARRAAELTAQMLAYAGKGHVNIEPLDLSQLVADITRLLEISISKSCVLQYNLPPNLPSIVADATQLRQVVMNLVINAFEAIGNRSGTIRVSTGVLYCDHAYLTDTYLDEDLPEGLYVSLSVSDNGAGMSAATRARIFEPFFTTKFTGRGLGLAALLGIVRSHRGAIKVYSEPGAGTTFSLLFPAVASAENLPTSPKASEAELRGHGTVLLIDDEESVRGLMRQMVERMGFAVQEAANGREALKLFRGTPAQFRCVLLDLTMPHMDGKATLRDLRRIRADVPVILMSGHSEQTAMSQFVGKRLSGFIQKPFRFEQLCAVMSQALQS
jgi:PAS domain S-box-containing protein